MIFRILYIGLVVSIATVNAHAWHVNVLWQRVGLEDSSGFGALIVPLGDQNDDGYTDWAVYAAPYYNPTDSAYLEFFHGGNTPSLQPFMTYTEAMTNGGSMGGASAIGDINGDGYQDWQVRVAWANPWGYFETQIFYGGPSADLVPDVRWHFHWAMPDEDQFHAIGDFNGDGYADLYKWRRGIDTGFACFGSVAFDTIPDWVRHAPSSAPYQTYPIGHGDINGDGFGDIAVRTYGTDNRLYVYWGGANPDTVQQTFFSLFQWGRAHVVNDLNGDNRDEIVQWDSNHVDLHLGRDSLMAAPDAVLNFPPSTYPAGTTISLGDVNDDGYGDMILLQHALFWDPNWDYLELYLGNYAVSPQPIWNLENWTGNPDLIALSSVAGLGDVNGDGVGDFAIGATNGASNGTRGEVVILSGDSTVHVSADLPNVAMPDKFSLSAYPNPFNSSTRLTYNLPQTTQINLSIFDLNGRLVLTLEDRMITAGQHSFIFDGSHLSSGIYFVRLNTSSLSTTQKLFLLK